MELGKQQHKILTILQSAKHRIINELVDLMGFQLRKRDIYSSQFNDNNIGYDFSCQGGSFNLYLYHNNINNNYYIKYKESDFVTKIKIEEKEFNRIMVLLEMRKKIQESDVSNDNCNEFSNKMNEFWVSEDYSNLDEEDQPFQ